MAVRPPGQPQAGRSRSGNATKLNAEISDQVWHAMIIMALKYQRRLGRYNNQRYDRKSVYFVLIVNEVASILVDNEVIHPWPGGFRRLHKIQEDVTREFKLQYGKVYFDI